MIFRFSTKLIQINKIYYQILQIYYIQIDEIDTQILNQIYFHEAVISINFKLLLSRHFFFFFFSCRDKYFAPRKQGHHIRIYRNCAFSRSTIFAKKFYEIRLFIIIKRVPVLFHLIIRYIHLNLYNILIYSENMHFLEQLVYQ